MIAAGLVVTGLVLAGCSGAEARPPTPIPTFAPTTGAAGPTALVPLDPCAALLSPSDVGNVLGIDAAKLGVRTVRGVPAPAVGRTERVDCTYTAEKGRTLFVLRSATYASEAAAQQQWQLNLGLLAGDRRPVSLGPISATLVEQKDEALLTTVVGPKTLAVQLPNGTVPQGRSRENLIVDFAQRALRIDPAATATPAPPSVQPVGAGG